MDSKNVLGYVKQLCRDLDSGKAPRRFSFRKSVLIPVAIPAAIGLSALGLSGCGQSSRYMEHDDSVEICDNGIDDDENGLTDCDDSACVEDEYCRPQAAYGVPFEICDDNADNDFDGLADCDDPDCAEFCGDVPVYGIPHPDPETICDDEIDNDMDGLTDCEDPDCEPYCWAEVMYGVPHEDCDDEIDNDHDGLIDCADPDCSVQCIQPMYGTPHPEPEFTEICNDGVDNDGDELADCEDPDCATFFCCDETVNLYGIPIEDCENEVDDTCDGLIDCEDPQCAESEVCLEASK